MSKRKPSLNKCEICFGVNFREDWNMCIYCVFDGWNNISPNKYKIKYTKSLQLKKLNDKIRR